LVFLFEKLVYNIPVICLSLEYEGENAAKIHHLENSKQDYPFKYIIITNFEVRKNREVKPFDFSEVLF